jgi:acyl-CoA thioesterase-1
VKIGAIYGSGRRESHGAIRLGLGLLLALLPAPLLAADRLVLALGDSLTAGYGLSANRAFPVRLEAALRQAGVAARVHNAGVSGDTSAQGRQRLAWVLTGVRAKPDLAIVELGANDMLRGLKPAETRANLDAILAELKRRGIPTILAGMRAAPNLGRAYAAAFEPIYPALARKYGARLYPFFLEGVEIVVRGILPTVRAALR